MKHIVCPCGTTFAVPGDRSRTDLPADLAIDGIFCSAYCRDEYHAERPRPHTRRQRAGWLADPADSVIPDWWNDETAPLPTNVRLIR